MAAPHTTAFAWWDITPVSDLTADQWEDLCDGCGRCCVSRFHYEDRPGEAAMTDVTCRLMDCRTARCTDYANRTRRVRGCTRLTPETLGDGSWLPTTCAYRLRAQGEPLFFWHHLVSGDRKLVHRVGIGVAGRVINARRGLDPETRIVEWRPGEGP